MREHFLEGHNLLLGQMSAVVDQDVKPGDLPLHLLPESAVGLIANEDPGVIVFESLAILSYIDPVDSAPRAKIFSPHVETAAAIHADFQHVDFFPDEFLKVPMVDVEVVRPLPDAPAFSVRIEKFLKRVGEAVLAYSVRGIVRRGPQRAVLPAANHGGKLPHELTGKPGIA
jgi:hypothetical protein